VRPILVTGAGTLGQAFARLCHLRGLACQLTSRSQLDIADRDAVTRAFDRCQPWAVVNTAGYVRVDDAERDAERCQRDNVAGPVALAAACARDHIPLVTFSTDLVFDGAKRAPYTEADPPAPLGVYGRTKAEAEVRVLDRHDGALVVRTSALFGPWDPYNFVTSALRTLSAGGGVRAAHAAVVSPTYVPDLVHACLDLLIDGESGLWHLSNAGAVTWAELARIAVRLAGGDERLVEAVPGDALGWQAPRPTYSALSSDRGTLVPPIAEALDRYLRERQPAAGGRT
jgi:dTDP-4-dehydrorhamnose reductase